MKTIDKIIDKVSSQYGSQMGRCNVDERPAKDGVVLDDYINNPKNKLYDCKVPMSGCGDYDKGGAYWGRGQTLRVSYTKDLKFIEFYRSYTKRV